jgi:thioredoxin-related protein
MKHILFLFLIFVATTVFAQKAPVLPAFKRYPTLPSLQLVLSDSSTKYTLENVPKKKKVLLMIFSPDCEHCQHEAEQIVASKEALKDIHIIMATTLPIYKMQAFSEKFGLDKMENVVIAKDPYYLLPGFYEIRTLPFAALYNKKGALIGTFEGGVGIEKILEVFSDAR